MRYNQFQKLPVRNGNRQVQKILEQMAVGQMLTIALRQQVERTKAIYGADRITLKPGTKIEKSTNELYVTAIDGVPLEQPIPLAFAGIAPLTEGLMK